MFWHLSCKRSLFHPLMKTLFTLIISAAALCLASCNTIAGAGQDMQQAGRSVTDAAADVAR